MSDPTSATDRIDDLVCLLDRIVAWDKEFGQPFPTLDLSRLEEQVADLKAMVATVKAARVQKQVSDTKRETQT